MSYLSKERIAALNERAFNSFEPAIVHGPMTIDATNPCGIVRDFHDHDIDSDQVETKIDPNVVSKHRQIGHILRDTLRALGIDV